MGGWMIFIIVYVILNFIFSWIVYSNANIFYKKKIIEVKEGNNTVKIALNEKYKPFTKQDSLSYMRIFLGMTLLFWIKFSSIIFLNISIIIVLQLIACVKKNNGREYSEKAVKFTLWCVGIVLGLRKEVIRIKAEEIYKKYLGNDYKFTWDEGYSAIVSNHTGWIDIMCYLQYYACGFISKASVANYPLIGIVAKQIGCLFVTREDASNRSVILEQIQERQDKFLNQNDKSLPPLMIFPEGTVTNGKYIMKLKKGAFNSLLPLKPILIDSTVSDDFHLSVPTGFVWHIVRTMCYLYHNVRITELPVVFPNDFMFARYKELHPEITEKWDIYSEVMREIMCESSGFLKPTNMTFRDACEHDQLILGRENKSQLLNENTTKGAKQD